MFRAPEETVRRFDTTIDAAKVLMQEPESYQKWLRYYLDFCAKFRQPCGLLYEVAGDLLEPVAAPKVADVFAPHPLSHFRLIG